MILGTNSRIILNNSNLVASNITNSLICPKGCQSINVSRDGNVLCRSCGLVLKSEEFEPEYYGGSDFNFQSNKRQDHMYGQSSNGGINYENRQREINKQIGEFCTQYSLSNNERDEVGQIVESMLRIMDEKKKKCRSLKSLVAACFYEYNKKLHKSIPINQMCKHFMIKQRKLLKYTKKLSKYDIQIQSGSITHSERIRNEWDEVMNTVTDKIKCFLAIGHSQSKYSATYKPEVNNFTQPNIVGQQQSQDDLLNNTSVAYKQQIKDIEEKSTSMKIEHIKRKIKDLYNCEYLSVTRMGKHPTNYICTLMYVILKSMNIEFKNNKFCDQVGIKYSTLSREKKEIMQYLCNSLIISPPIISIPPRIQSELDHINQLSGNSEGLSFNNKLPDYFIAYTLDHVISISSNSAEETQSVSTELPIYNSTTNYENTEEHKNSSVIGNIMTQDLVNSACHNQKIILDNSFSFESCTSSQQQSPVRRQATRASKLVSSSSAGSSSSQSSGSPSSGSDEDDVKKVVGAKKYLKQKNDHQQ